MRELRPERDLNRNPIFQVMFTLRPGARLAAMAADAGLALVVVPGV
ncbi:MAG: hypothetical protein ABR511_01795 [Acidimicrobiales bacterium]